MEYYITVHFIKYSDEQPPIGVEVLAFNKAWKEDEFDSTGLRVGYRDEEDNFIHTSWDNDQDCWSNISSEDIDSTDEYVKNEAVLPEYWAYKPILK